MKIERHNWQPSFPNEIWITEGSRSDKFTITLKQGSDVEIEFDWDHSYDGRGTERMFIPLNTLKELIDEISKT